MKHSSYLYLACFRAAGEDLFWRTLHESKPNAVPNTEQGNLRGFQFSELPGFCLCTLPQVGALAGSLVSLCRDQRGQHLRCPQELADHAESRQLYRIFVYLAEVGVFCRCVTQVPEGLTCFCDTCFSLFCLCL